MRSDDRRRNGWGSGVGRPRVGELERNEGVGTERLRERNSQGLVVVTKQGFELAKLYNPSAGVVADLLFGDEYRITTLVCFAVCFAFSDTAIEKSMNC